MTKNNAPNKDAFTPPQLLAEYDENGDPITHGVTKIEHYEDAMSLPVFKFPDPVRLRPGMYIGDVGVRGLHHLFKEIIDNVVDEVLAGHCTEIDVVLDNDYTITVSDNGRGIPVHIVGSAGETGIELAFTDLHSGKYLNAYHCKVSDGIGASCVNALSEWLECSVKKEGKTYRMRFERGIPVMPLEIVGECDAGAQGTTVQWLADKMMFKPALTESGELAYDGAVIARRCRELAYHLPAARITFRDRLHAKPPETLHFPNGVADYVRDLNRGRVVFPAEPIAMRGVLGETQVEVALQYSNADSETVLGFANMVPTLGNGTHITGFRRAVTKTINALGAERTKHSGATIHRGLTAVISITLPKPIWYGSSRDRLINHELKGIVFSVVYAGLKKHWADFPEQKCVFVNTSGQMHQEMRLVSASRL